MRSAARERHIACGELIIAHAFLKTALTILSGLIKILGLHLIIGNDLFYVLLGTKLLKINK